MGANLQKRRPVYSQPLFGRGPGGGASLREAASPGALLPFLLQAGRGGSVSRRDHNQLAKGTRPTRMGANLQKRRPVYSQPLFGRGPGGGASLREAASPGALLPILLLAGRGGSVSRRDHNQLARKRAQLAWARTSKREDQSIPSYSSGGGPGEGLLLEKPPPPEYLSPSFPK